MPPRSPNAVRRDKLSFRRAGGIRRIVGVPAQDESSRSVNPVTGLFEPEATRLGRALAVLGDAGTPDLANWSLRLTPSETIRPDGSRRAALCLRPGHKDAGQRLGAGKLA